MSNNLRSRDVEIAKLKSWHTIRPLSVGLKGWSEDGYNFLPEWSTDRNAAWELLNEMLETGYIVEIKLVKRKDENFYAVHFRGVCIAITSSKGTIDRAFADCISQAWIKWMEGKK
jgi:hypothetical protein